MANDSVASCKFESKKYNSIELPSFAKYLFSSNTLGGSLRVVFINFSKTKNSGSATSMGGINNTNEVISKK